MLQVYGQAVDPDGAEAEPNAAEEDRGAERHLSRVVVVLGGVGVALVIVSLSAWLSDNDTVRVPKFIGQSTAADRVSDTTAFAADLAGLGLEATEATTCPARDADLIIEQTPLPGEEVGVGTVVRITVCHPFRRLLQP